MTYPLSSLRERMSFAPDYSEDISAIEEQMQSKRGSALQNFALASQEPRLSTSQALAQGLMTLVPALIGMAIAKKKGGALGAQAGLDAGNSYGQVIEKRNKSAQIEAKAKAALDEEDYKDLKRQKSDLEKTGRDQSFQLGKLKLQEEGDDRRANLAHTDRQDQLRLQREKLNFDKSKANEVASPELQSIYNELTGRKGGSPPVTNAEVERAMEAVNTKRLVGDSKLRSDKYKSGFMSLLPPGTEPKSTNEDGIPMGLDREGIGRYNKKREAAVNIRNNLIDLTQSVERNGEIVVSGSEFQKRMVKMASLLRQYKDLFGGGAAYTELEAKLANLASPQLWGSPFVKPSEVLKNQGLGRNATDIMKYGIQQIERELGVAADVAGLRLTGNPFVVDEGNTPESFLKEGGGKRERMNIGGLEFDVVG